MYSSVFVLGRFSCPRQVWQVENKSHPRAARLGVNLSAVFIHDLFADCQPQPATRPVTATFVAPASLENVLQVLGPPPMPLSAISIR